MLMAHPAVLAKLIEEYETLKGLHAQADTPQVRRRLEDVTYTLCVSTGTRDGESALAAARRQLRATRLEDDSLLIA
ncbi:DUF5133 domain-containing protein [Streptomyces sp. SP18CS02]|uniref:DUF5133 domain-containing protein n=1 Tax=Streptomyces sp. SP18CS02 TaxID=3002531 RepID=UPI002E76C64F|nr:DUF5133 domain-containing protein [Streptomyces sp. SP18CS02]MEE1754563.1 DUF5133 domain-containing protein [Streptomyces sp. SP18CS02]